MSAATKKGTSQSFVPCKLKCVLGAFDFNEIHATTTTTTRERTTQTSWACLACQEKGVGVVYSKAKPLADGVSVNKSATCSAAKINICVNKSHEGKATTKNRVRASRASSQWQQPQPSPQLQPRLEESELAQSEHSGSSCVVVSVYITCLDLSTRI